MQKPLQIDSEELPILHRYQHLLHNKLIKGTDLHILPNGLPVLGANTNEIQFLYKEKSFRTNTI